jgi:hypothetical protein
MLNNEIITLNPLVFYVSPNTIIMFDVIRTILANVVNVIIILYSYLVLSSYSLFTARFDISTDFDPIKYIIIVFSVITIYYPVLM